MSHKGAVNRVVGVGAGLILLLMAYSIYKVVMMNALRLQNDFLDVKPDSLGEPLAEHNQQTLQPNDTPGVPGAPGGRARSNLQVSPYASHP